MCGCSSSTSTWRTVAAWSGGADTSASRRVSSESASVVAWSVASTSPVFAERSSGKIERPPEPLEQRVDVDAVAAVGGDAARRRVRVRQQPARLELGELRPHGRRRHPQPAAGDEVLRPDRLPRADVLLDTRRRTVLLALGEARAGVVHEWIVPAVQGDSGVALRDELGGHAAAEQPPARREHDRARAGLAARTARPSRSTRASPAVSTASSSPSSARGSSSRSPSSTCSVCRVRAVELLDVALRKATRDQCGEVAPDARRRSASGCPSTVETAPTPTPR